MPPTTMRLDRLLANMGYGTRREITDFGHDGRILLDGAPMKNTARRIALSADLADRLRVDDAPIDPLPGLVLMLNKPVGVTCSHKEAGPLVYDLLPPRWKRRDPKISTVGRLDKETSGLLLLTDDGQLLHKIISPRHHVAKRYHVTLDRPLNGTEPDLFASGTMMLESEEKPLRPVAMEILGPTTARVTLHEGRYHQVRRMFAATANHVVALDRETVGGLMLPDTLIAGRLRVLSPKEVALIFNH